MITQNLHCWQTELENDLVRMIPLKESDFERLFQVASDPLIWEQHPNHDRYQEAAFRIYFEGAIASKTAFLTLEKQSNEIMGCTRYYDFDLEKSCLMIGYTFLARKYWGGNHNGASKKLLLDHAFQYVEKVGFQIAEKNLRSQKAVIKLGAKKENEIYLPEHDHSQILHYEYFIYKNDWI